MFTKIEGHKQLKLIGKGLTTRNSFIMELKEHKRSLLTSCWELLSFFFQNKCFNSSFQTYFLVQICQQVDLHILRTPDRAGPT